MDGIKIRRGNERYVKDDVFRRFIEKDKRI